MSLSCDKRTINAAICFHAVIERFELSEGRNPGDITISDLPLILKMRKELCDAQVRWLHCPYFFKI